MRIKRKLLKIKLQIDKNKVCAVFTLCSSLIQIDTNKDRDPICEPKILAKS